MKRTLSIVLCAGLISLGGITTSRAAGYVASAADVVVVRPLGFAATVIGSVFYVVALPVAAASHSVKETGDALVVTPAQFTFTRPVGEFKTPKEEPSDVESMRNPPGRQARNSERPSEKANRTKVTNRRQPSPAPASSSPPTRQSMPT